MRKMIIIIIILAIIFVGMLINNNIASDNQNNITINEVNQIEEYIKEIYMWKEVTNEALPKFDNINLANELWIWEVVKKNLEDFELEYNQIQDEAINIFGTELELKFPKEGNLSFEFNERINKYQATQTNLDNQDDTFLLNNISKIENGYEVEIIEYIRDYSEVEQNENIILIKNLSNEEIGRVMQNSSEQEIQEIVKRNKEKFSIKKLELEKNNNKIYVKRIT